MSTPQYEMKVAPGEYPPAYGPPQPQPGYPSQPPQPQPGYPPQQYAPQTVVVSPQPVAMVREGEQVQDNMVISIISIFFCCILGIIATVKANNSKEALRAGRVDDALRDSITARKLAIAAIVTGVIIIALTIFFTFILPLIAAGVVVGVHG